MVASTTACWPFDQGLEAQPEPPTPQKDIILKYVQYNTEILPERRLLTTDNI